MGERGYEMSMMAWSEHTVSLRLVSAAVITRMFSWWSTVSAIEIDSRSACRAVRCARTQHQDREDHQEESMHTMLKVKKKKSLREKQRERERERTNCVEHTTGVCSVVGVKSYACL
jgi:hypothetical protein